MTDFEQLVADLGPDAKHLTTAQLLQLDRELQTLAELLVGLYKIRHPTRRPRSPQRALDRSGTDLSLKT